ncbi:Anti-sigma-K factor rskA [Cryobacterium flavum]|uniref:Regulator of SigK n=1 Tax=Cryobacterium flavum TaxID=1424659 RepID=A0A4R8VFP1_9MICO|nr:anti-sigma factor [Cryobacterium flavum]TFB81050.1 anti-sigma factor [Cryobacterium flavum]SDM78755.1 Anti-sigma-K factor rskA [Cryobacterium flavum]
MTGRNEQHPADLAGAYALHALDADDTATFEALLAESERARIEAAELNDTAVALGLAVAPVQPSAALKANLMSLLASTPQLPPLTAGTTDALASVTNAAPVVAPIATPTLPAGPTSTTPNSGGGAPAGSASAVTDINFGTGSGPHRTATERAQARWFKRPAQFMLAAAAAVALFIGGSFFGQVLNSNQFESQQASGLAQINAADDSQRAATTTANGQEATLVWSNKLGISAVLVDKLPVLPSDQDYQLWYINGDGAASAGTFDSTGDGTAWRVLDGTMHAGDQVGVTVEPNGGSDQPTTNPIVAFQS